MSVLFPLPLTPVTQVSMPSGMRAVTSFRLFSRAPRTRIHSWASAAGEGVVMTPG